MAKKNTDYLEAAKKAREEAAQRYESGQEIRTEAKIKNTWGNTGSKNAGASTSSEVKIENRTKTDVAKLTQQKKKEDASAFKVLSETEKKSNTAKKALEDYLASDEKKALKKKQMDDQMAKAMLFGVTDAQMEQEVDRKEEQLKKEADYWEAQVKKEREAKTMERDTKAVESWDDADKEELERYIQNRQSAFVQSLNPAATGLPAQYEDSYLIQKYGRQRLDEIASSYQRQKNAEKIAAQEQRGRDAVNANGFSAAGANVTSVGANLADTLLNPLGRIANMAGGKDARYSTLDPNAGGQAAAYASGVRQQSAENIAGSEEGVQLSDGLNKREALALAYQGGMGFLDTAARSAVGMSPTVGAGLAAMGSFNQTLADASAKGATPAEAVAMATASAGIEALTEKIPLDELFKVANSGSKSFGKVLLNVMKQMGIEVLEEEASLIATTLAEAAILRGKSSYNQQIMGAVLDGVPFEQAKAMADNAILEEAKQTAIVSAVSGFMGATGAEYNAYRYSGNVDNQQEQNAAPQATEATQTAQQEEQTQTQDNVEQPAQTEQEQPQTVQAPEKTPQNKAMDSTVETITGKKQEVAEPSTQQMDTFEQSTEGGQIKGTGAAEANFSGKAAYQDLLQEGNVQPDRPGDVRPMEVPKTDGNGKRVTEFAANAYGAEVTTDDMANTIESLIQDGELGFDVRTNRESLDNAAAAIKKRGAAATRKQLTNRIDRKKIQDGDIEQGILLYAKYAEKGDIDNASEMLVDLAQMANITGRNLQMFKLLRRMTVEGQVMTLEKEVRRTVESLVRSGQVKKDYEPTFDPDLMSGYRKALEELRAAKTPEAQEAAKQKAKETQDAIYAVEAAKMPATIKAKWDAWRYMAMLGNVKTQVRNIAGNIMFKPYKEVKDTAAALFEKALPKDRRTKALVHDPALLKWAKSDAGSEDVQNALKYTAKLGDDVTSQKISEQRQIFDNKVLDNVRKFVEKVPQAGDMLFKNDYYARSLAGFLKARGYTAAQIQNGQIDNAVLTEARTYAIDEAMKATFNDSNAFSDAISSIGRGGQDNPWKKALNVAAEGILPFRRTPANIVVRFAEYSPAGIAKGMWDMATHVRNGDMSAAAAIDQIAAGLTGTGMMALGYMMAAGMNGVKLTGSGTEEDEKRQGHQDYALEFAYDGQEYSYRIDWAAPANLPLFVGANIYNAMQNAGADPDVSKFTSIIRGMGTAFEPMLALSCLSSFNDLVEGIRYAQEGEAVYNMAANVATSYFTQGIPALLRQGYQATQETKQTTFANDADPTIRDLQKTAANIPFVGDKFQTEKVNAWGETEDQGDWMTRTFNAFVNPGSVKEIDNGPLEQEMNRLNDAQTENVTPPTATKTLSYTDKQGNAHNNVRLTEEQYQTFAQTQGKTAKDILDSMIKSADYAAMNDEQKAKAIQQAYSYARKKAEIAAIGDDHTGYDESWMMEMDAGAGADYIIRRVTKSEISGAMDALDTAWDKGYDTTGRSDDLKWAYDTFSKMSDGAKADAREWLTGTAAKYVEAREKGISHDDFLSAAKNVELVKGTGSNGTVRDIDRREAIAKTTGLSAKEIDTVMKAYMEDYDPDAESPKTTEIKYDYIRHVMGLTPAQYAETYRARLDNSKKKDQIAAMVALGYDKKVATKLYNIYAGNKKGKAAYMGYYNSK